MVYLNCHKLQGWFITYIRRDENERRKREREIEEQKNSMDLQERTLKHFEEEKKKLEKTLDKSKL